MHFPPRKPLGKVRPHWTIFPVFLALLLAFSSTFPGVASAAEGYATWYGADFQGNEMRNGQIYNMYDPTTTASNMFPLGTWVRVTNPANGKSVVVQVRDTGAFTHAFDLSYAAFKAIADPNLMGIPVRYEVVSGPSGKPIAPVASPTPTPKPAPAAPATKTGSAAAGSPAPKTYVVQSGDTLNSIAEQFGLDSADLARWNGLGDPDTIIEGQTLHLTAPASAPSQPAKATPPPSATYVVQAGDTLLAIARRYGVTLNQLATANNLADPYPIVVGQTLTIPGTKSASAPAAPATKSYVIQPGDTLDAIAIRYGVTADRLAAANGIANPDLIQPGTTLTIP